MTENQFVVFKLGNEKYCIDILNVAGITECERITKVPDAPSYVLGVMSLRGDIIPIVDLKKKFKLKHVSDTEADRIILINLNDKTLGFLVDEANQVVKIQSEDIDPTPDILKGKDKDYISGIGKIDGEMYIILELEKVLAEDEAQEILDINN